MEKGYLLGRSSQDHHKINEHANIDDTSIPIICKRKHVIFILEPTYISLMVGIKQTMKMSPQTLKERFRSAWAISEKTSQGKLRNQPALAQPRIRTYFNGYAMYCNVISPFNLHSSH